MATTKKKSTEIAAVKKSNYLAIAGSGGAASVATMEANLETLGVADLPKVKVPSGGQTTWLVPNIVGDDEATKTLRGVFCVYAQNGVLWPSEGEAPSGTLPVLSTSDLRRAYRIGDDLGDIEQEKLDEAAIPGEFDAQGRPVVDWQKLYYCQWGTSARGKGKRAKERRIIGILREEDRFPLLVSVPPTSLRNVTNFVKALILQDVPHYKAVIELTLTKESSGGNDYGVINVHGVGTISDAEAAFVKQRFTDPIMSELQVAGSFIEE